MSTKLVNLTPHALNLRVAGRDIIVPPTAPPARVAVNSSPCGEVTTDDGLNVPVVGNTYGEIENLPIPQDGVVFLVSALVLGRVRGRTDVFAPDSGPTAIRFGEGPKKGQIEAVVRLVAPDA